MSDAVLSNFTQTVKEEREYGRKFKVAIIGTGWIAESHAESYLAQPDVEIVALADLTPGKAAAFAKQYGKQAEAVKLNYLEGQDQQEYQVSRCR